jgi:hypothetical protein
LEKTEAQDRSKRESASETIDKCLARTPDKRLKSLANMYVMLSESRKMYGIEMWDLEEGWKEIRKIHIKFCKIIIQVLRF